MLDAHADADPEARGQLCAFHPGFVTIPKTHRFPAAFADYVADYENPISPEILRTVNSRVVAGDKNDHLLLPPEVRLSCRIMPVDL